MANTKIFCIFVLWLAFSGAVMGCIAPPTFFNSNTLKSNNMNTEKKCTECGNVKPIVEFNNHNLAKDGLQSRCKHCRNVSAKIYHKTKSGLSAKMFSDIKYRTTLKNFESIDYDLNQLRNWLFTQFKFHDLYTIWKESNYDKQIKPSIDRIDDYKGYSFENIQLMTWGDNATKGRDDIRNGINNKMNIAVVKTEISTGKEIEYYSISQAARETKALASKICLVCKGKRKTAAGYEWRYKNTP